MGLLFSDKIAPLTLPGINAQGFLVLFEKASPTMRPLKLGSLRYLTQRWDSPRQLLQRGKPPQRTGSQALIRVCPTLFA
jgi:hypothetical protein